MTDRLVPHVGVGRSYLSEGPDTQILVQNELTYLNRGLVHDENGSAVCLTAAAGLDCRRRRCGCSCGGGRTKGERAVGCGEQGTGK